MHIHWLLPQNIEHIHELVRSPMASCRLRAGALWTAIRHTEHHFTVGEVLDAGADVCVIGKVGGFETGLKHKAWVDQLRNFKGRIVLDFTDDHLSHTTVMSVFYADCLQLAHQVVCSSVWLQSVVEQRFAGPVRVIEDAIDVPIVPPKNRIGDPLRVLWFGHASNMRGLTDFLPLLPRNRALEMVIVSNPQGLQMLHGYKLPSPMMTVRPRVWSLSEMMRAAQESDICIIAVEQSSMRKAGVSANRLLTALTLGLPTAADTVPSYADFSPYFSALRTSAFHELLHSPLDASHQVQAFQREVPARFSMKAMGQTWLDFLSEPV